MSDNLVPEPQSTIFDAVNAVVGNEDEAQAIIANPSLAKDILGNDDASAVKSECCGGHGVQSQDHECACRSDGIELKGVDEIGRATAADVKEALHQVIDPELGIDVIDLGLVYGIEIDELGRAIITMTLTTPACPLTDLIEDECASTLAGLVEEFRIDWTWTPRWTVDKITPEGRDQLAALGFNLDNMPRYCVVVCGRAPLQYFGGGPFHIPQLVTGG